MNDSEGQTPGREPGMPDIPEHTLLRCVGGGSYGEVWLARTVHGQFRAVKVVHRSWFEEDGRPFEREYEGLQRFDAVSRRHPSQLPILQIGRNEAAGYFYYVMEPADDVTSGQEFQPDAYAQKTLSQVLKNRGRLPLAELLPIALALTDALEHLHGSRLIHRDIKPSNIVWHHGVPKLADIGLVTAAGERGTLVGTTGYFPEGGVNDAAGDLFSLGKVLYQAATGLKPELFPRFPDGLPNDEAREELRELNEILLRACASKPTERYRSAAELRRDLESLKAGQSLWTRRRQRKHAVMAAVAILAVAVGLAAQHWRKLPRPPAETSKGLVHWWKGDGDARDAAGSAHGKMLAGGGFVPGRFGQAFSGVVEISDQAGLNFRAEQPFTIALWAFPTNASIRPQHVLGKRDEQSLAYQLAMDGRGLNFGPGGWAGATVSPQLLPERHWTHLAATSDGRGTVSLLVNGVVSATGPGTFGIASPVSLKLGGAGPYQPFAGYLDDIRIYHRALSPDEIDGLVRDAPPEEPPRPILSPAGLIHWWPGEGDARDVVGGAHGTLAAGLAFVPGRVGQAFNGVITVPDTAGFNFASNRPFTLEFWARPTNEITVAHILGKRASTARNHFQFAQDRRGLHFNTELVEVFAHGARLVPDQWTHLAATAGDGQLRIYVDGQLRGTTPGGLGQPNPAPLELGSASGTAPFPGYLDEISLYERVLSEAELGAIYRSGSAGKLRPTASAGLPPPPGLVHWWPGEGDARDVIGRAHGTMSGGSGFAAGQVGQAFAGTVAVPHPLGINFDRDSSMTLELWVRPTNGPGSGHIIGKRVGCDVPSPSTFQLATDGGGLHFSASPGIRLDAATGKLPLDVWTHLGLTHDGKTLSLYVNGELSASRTQSLGPTNSAPLKIGGSGDCAPFAGLTDEVSIYNRALTAAEIRAIHRTGVAGKQLPPGYQRRPARLAAPATLPVRSTNSLGMVFVPVPGTAAQFCIWHTRVQDYAVFAAATNHEWPKPTFEQGSAHPAVMVSWEDAREFCRWLTESERRAGRIPSGASYRLPQDWEWSMAVGLNEPQAGTPQQKDGKTKGVYPWGTQWPPPRGVGNYHSSYGVDDFDHTSPVGSFPANALGLYDLGGNVWHWCEEFYNGTNGARIIRGASWHYGTQADLLSSCRFRVPPETRDHSIGFRLVLSGGGEAANGVPTASPGSNMAQSNAPAILTALMADISAPSAARRWTNSLGQIFVSVPGLAARFCIWETRVQDFAAFTDAAQHQAAWPVRDLGGAALPGDWRNPLLAPSPQHPVCAVSWEDAQAFCRWLTARERASGALRVTERYRLPTDMEWSAAAELTGEVGATPAARSGKVTGLFPWGSSWPPLPGSGNYAGEESGLNNALKGYRDGYVRTAPVGCFPPNRHGLFDLGGNLAELCEDWSDSREQSKVARGGDWNLGTAESLLTSKRFSAAGRAPHVTIGFRVVLAQESAR